VAEASLLARKWQDKGENFQDIRKRGMEFVPELGPSFEEAKEEICLEKSQRRTKTEDKGKKHAFREATKEPRT
jgi:hypothetical protein